jgi:catechol 2,3-dioxygenase-like lactoylglutathione lyase family enzyme
MTNSVPPKVECEQFHASLLVTDVPAAVEFYTSKLGFRLGFMWGEPPTMAGVNLGSVQIFLEQGTPNPRGISLYFVIGDADELYEFHCGGEVEIAVPPDDRLYGLRDYTVRDLHGYALCFGHRLQHHETGPQLKIERVDVPLRLEKRLAALVQDLAEHKHMTVNSCLEEILLHTNEPLGDGVASPHTKNDLDYIQELKKKHGIDYDSHASYRFVEEGTEASTNKSEDAQ